MRDKRGNVTLIAATAMPVILLTGFFATDVARVWLVQARLQAAVDAAALLVARDINDPNRDANGRAVAANNYNANAGGSPQINSTSVQITQIGSDQVKVQASADVPLYLSVPRFSGSAVFNGNYQVTRSGTAHRTSTGVEMALVFDVTWSMRSGDGTNSGKSRIESARDAAYDMMKILYGDGPSTTTANRKNWAKNLYVSVVPFNVAVNFGPANTHMLDTLAPAPAYPPSWAGVATGWAGCMEVRDRDHLDAAPVGAAGMRRYYWPSTYNASAKFDPARTNSGSAQPHCLSSAAYTDNRTNRPSGAHQVCMGHNDWTAPAYVFDQKQNTLIADVYAQGRPMAWDRNNGAHGPNKMCPTHTVLPLTMDRNVIESKIGAMVNIPYSSGTAIATGLQAAWFTLSPNWRASSGTFEGWPSAEPSPRPADGRSAPPPLPLDYNTPNMRKVIVLLSDGDNNWLSARARQNNGTDLVRPESRRVELYYNGYGQLGRDYTGDDRLDVTIPTGHTPNSSSLANAAASTTVNAELAMDAEVVRLCNDIKGTDANGRDRITIYAIGIGVAETAHRTLMENCVSRPNTVHYIHANTSDKLKAAFSTVAQELATLRLVQ